VEPEARIRVNPKDKHEDADEREGQIRSRVGVGKTLRRALLELRRCYLFGLWGRLARVPSFVDHAPISGAL
jgi:hypothetical protein